MNTDIRVAAAAVADISRHQLVLGQKLNLIARLIAHAEAQPCLSSERFRACGALYAERRRTVEYARRFGLLHQVPDFADYRRPAADVREARGEP